MKHKLRIKHPFTASVLLECENCKQTAVMGRSRWGLFWPVGFRPCIENTRVQKNLMKNPTSSVPPNPYRHPIVPFFGKR